jgi:hypothetical protein
MIYLFGCQSTNYVERVNDRIKDIVNINLDMYNIWYLKLFPTQRIKNKIFKLWEV